LVTAETQFSNHHNRRTARLKVGEGIVMKPAHHPGFAAPAPHDAAFEHVDGHGASPCCRLKPAVRIAGMNPALGVPHRQGLTGVDAEKVELRCFALRRRLAPANESVANSPVRSVMYFPQKAPGASVCLGVGSGKKSSAKFFPGGSVRL
jgi:hypothetical protein